MNTCRQKNKQGVVDMRIAVTGSAGFIGSAFLWKLNKEGINDIYAVDVGETGQDSPNLENKRIKEYIERDRFLELVKTGHMDKDLDIIVHLGACADTTETDIKYLQQNNYLYSVELAKWCMENSKSFLYASSAATYGAGEKGYSDSHELIPSLRPLNEYGRSKQAFDEWLFNKGLIDNVVGFKFFNVYGPNEYHKQDMRSMVNKGYYQIKQTNRLRLFRSHRPEYIDGGQKRDFIYIKDALEVMWFFIQHRDQKGIFNVGTGNAHTWNELAFALFNALGRSPDIEYFDMPDNIKNQYQYFTQADISKLRNTGCAFRFTDIKDAVKDYVGYLERNDYL
jgi:ADP-L-glycero-D-manno-heptose 6-epimerase